MMTPRARRAPICSIRLRWKRSSWSSSSAVWTEATRYGPCARMETRSGSAAEESTVDIVDLDDLEPEQPLGFLDALLQVTDRVHFAEVDSDGDQGLGDLGGEPGDDHRGAHELRGVDSLHKAVGHPLVHVGNTGNIDHHHLGTMPADAPQQLFGELACARTVEYSDDR